MTYVIAEIGVNHNGKIDLAEKLIFLAKEAGADAVKFQFFQADKLARKDTPKTTYQLLNDLDQRSHYQMLKSLELTKDNFIKLRDITKKINLDFVVTPYGLEDLKNLIDIGVDIIKIASADLTDKSLVESACRTQLPLIISTGMSTLHEIQRTCNTIKEYGVNDFSLLHCTSSYPAENNSLNIKAINQLKDYTKKIGYSDHSKDGLGSYIAAAYGAEVFERHITLDKNMEGPDHHCSDELKDFSSYIKNIKAIKLAIGNGIKDIHESEKNMKIVSRKSAYLKIDVNKGSSINITDFVFQRPGNNGLNEYEICELVSKKYTYRKSFKIGEKFENES